MGRAKDNDQEIALEYVLDRLENNENMRQCLVKEERGVLEDYPGQDVLYLLKKVWVKWSEDKKISMAKTFAGPMHYNSFIEIMNSETKDKTKSA